MSDEVLSRLYVWLKSLGFDRKVCKVEVQDSTAAEGGRKLVAKEAVKAGDLLVAIPRKALLNRSTLTPFYSRVILDVLTANQLICLHLCKYRIHTTTNGANATSFPFAEYIDSLPTCFDSVPLQTAFGGGDTKWTKWVTACLIPHGLQGKIDDVYTRCKHDYEAVCVAYTSQAISKKDFVWAWLCGGHFVRCIWFDLHLPAREDNITLAPIIDMANHVAQRREYVSQTVAHLKLYASAADFSDKINTVLTDVGDEVFFTYGSHDNYTLLAEYGFVLSGLGNPDANLDITKDILALFSSLPSIQSESKQALLEQHSYLGEYHLISNENGVFEPSFRTIIALNLLHADKAMAANRTGTDIEGWIQLVNGEVDRLSEAISAAVHVTLLQICGAVIQRAETAISAIAEISTGESTAILTMLKQLWQTECDIAMQYVNSSKASEF